MLTFELAGNVFSATFLQSAQILQQQGYSFVSLVVFLTAIVFPIINSVVIIFIYLEKTDKIDIIKSKSLKKVYSFTKSTSFIEVYLLALLVGYIKLVDISDVTVHTSIYFFIGYVLFFILSMSQIHTTQEFHYKHEIQNSYNWSFALIVTGLILYIPANYFTMMNISKFGFVTPDTIMSGIINLATHDMLHIAIIVFIASIIIPLFKLLGMLFILLSIKFNFYNNKITLLKLYKFIEIIGKWSILDVYMVALLISYVKDESIAFIEPGVAVTFFTVVILVTMVATSLFDTKLLWNNNE
jgi:paraquat-inducible protein A